MASIVYVVVGSLRMLMEEFIVAEFVNSLLLTADEFQTDQYDTMEVLQPFHHQFNLGECILVTWLDA